MTDYCFLIYYIGVYTSDSGLTMCGEMRADSWFGKNSTYANDGIAYDKAFNKLVPENATEDVGLGT